MDLDIVTIVLSIMLGASIANLLDELFHLSPKLTGWINGLLGE